MKLLRFFAAALMFVGILGGCLAILLLVILIVRYPPFLVAMVLTCWIVCHVLDIPKKAAPTMLKP